MTKLNSQLIIIAQIKPFMDRGLTEELMKLLHTFAFSEIHQAILDSDNIYTAIKKLSVSESRLEDYLKQFEHNNRVLSFKALQQISSAEMTECYGEKYHLPWVPHILPLNKRPFSEIHANIKGTINYTTKLKVSIGLLRSYLNQFKFRGMALTPEKLREIPLNEMRKIYGDYYDKPWESLPKITLEKRSFAEIHQIILTNSDERQIAKTLDIPLEDLKSYLSQFYYYNTPLSISKLKEIPPETMSMVYGNMKYYEAWPNPSSVALNKKPFSEIHRLILEISTEKELAEKLGKSIDSLSCYLATIYYEGQPLSRERLKKISKSQMQQLANYNEPWRATLENKTLAQIHGVILNASDIDQAANLLGVDTLGLELYIGSLYHDCAPLSFTRLKNLTVKAMESIYDARYQEPWYVNNFTISLRPFSLIHKLILKTSDLQQAAIRLGVAKNVLENYLAKFALRGIEFNVDILKKITPQQMKSFYPSKYHQPWPVNEINAIPLDYTPFEKIYTTILKSRSKHGAAKSLKVSANALDIYLQSITYKDEPLSYERLQITPQNEIEKISQFKAPWMKNRRVLCSQSSQEIIAINRESSTIEATTFGSNDSFYTDSEMQTGIDEELSTIQNTILDEDDASDKVPNIIVEPVDKLIIDLPTHEIVGFENSIHRMKDYFNYDPSFFSEPPSKRRKLSDQKSENNLILKS